MKRNRLLALLLTLCMIIGLTSALTWASENADPDIDYDEVFVVVHTNDVHGEIGIEPYVKAVADDMKTQYGEKNVITVSAGDVFSGGNAVAHLYNGETIPPIMDAAGYDMIVFGNNDFHTTPAQVLKLAGMFEKTKVLCANLFDQVLDENGAIVYDENGSPLAGDSVFDRTMTFETEGGVKVGVFGLTVTGDPLDDDYTCMGSIQGAQESVDILKNEGCTVIVGVGHTGWNDDLVTATTNDICSAELVKNVPGIDVYVDGHSHSIIGGGNGWVCPETGTLVNQASCMGACLGVMKLYIKDGVVVEKTAEILTEDDVSAVYAPDPEVNELVVAAFDRLNSDMGDMYIETPYFLNGLRASENPDGRSIRTDETNLGDLCADFARWLTKADVAVIAGFTLRDSIEAGPIYTLDLYNVFANGCQLYVYEVTGEQLLRKMASSLGNLPTESTLFNQISGASYGYLVDESISNDAGGDSAGDSAGGDAAGAGDSAGGDAAAAGDSAGGDAAAGDSAGGDAAAAGDSAGGDSAGGDSAGGGSGKTFTIINPMVGGEPLDLSKTYLYATNNNTDAPADQDPVISTMEEAAEAMGEYLMSGEAVILPDVPTPDNRIVPMEEIPEGAVVYEVTS